MKKTKKSKAKYSGEITYTYENLKELMISARNIQRIIYLVLIIIIMIEQVYFFITIKKVSISFPLVCMLLCSYVLYFDFNRTIYNNKVRNNNGKEVTQLLEFFDDTIKVTNKDLNLSFDFAYSDIQKVYETKNIIAIMVKKNLGLAIHKDSISEKQRPKLYEFLKEKCNFKKDIKKISVVNENIFWVLLVLNIAAFLVFSFI